VVFDFELDASVALRQADLTLQSIMAGVATAFVAVLLLVNLLVYLVVLRPLRRIGLIANAVSEGQAGIEHFKINGNDEIASLSVAFNRMRRSLEKAMSMLA